MIPECRVITKTFLSRSRPAVLIPLSKTFTNMVVIA
jgi:hypothetical protein